MIKLVLSDMDDTLIPAGAPRVSARAIEAIHAAQAAGVHFGPVSGRQPDAMGWMFPENPECYATGAFCNGQVMIVDGDVVDAKPLDNEALMRLATFLEEETDDTFLKVYDLGADFRHSTSYCVTADAARVDAAMGSGSNAWLNEGAPNRFGIDDVAHYKANIWSTRTTEELAQLRVRMDEVAPELAYVFPNNHARLFDILPMGWNKGSAVAVIARALGVGMDEVAVFGDSDNDLPMIETVPNAVAMGNANDRVRAAARWHIGDAADEAEADALLDIARAATAGTMPTFMSA